MNKPVDVRALDEWIYALNTALGELDAEVNADAVTLLSRTLDDMRERRAQMRLERHNELGY